jgi:signal transduction histidine kinase
MTEVLRQNDVDVFCDKLQKPHRQILQYLEQIKYEANSFKQKSREDAKSINGTDKYVNSLARRATQLAIDMENFLVWTKWQTNTLHCQATLLNPSQIVADSAALFQSHPGQAIAVLPDTMKAIFLNLKEEHIKLILVNLINNSISLNPRATITVSEEHASDINITFIVEVTNISTTVEETQRLSSFFSDEVVDESFDLDLIVCKILAKALNGAIAVQSMSRSTTFKVTLPCQEASSTSQATDIVVSPKQSTRLSSHMDRSLTGYTADLTNFLAQSGEMGKLILSVDWSKTDVGSMENWPQSLVSSISICLKNSFPMSIWWGPKFTFFYNDSYRPFLGAKHPVMGKKAIEEVWSELEVSIGDSLRGALNGETSSFYEDALLVMERKGFPEECYFIYTLCPIYEENMKVGGVFNTGVETTRNVLQSRRLSVVRELSNINKTSSTTEYIQSLQKTLANYPHDLPFLLMYLYNEKENKLKLHVITGVERGKQYSAEEVLDNDETAQIWSLWSVMNTKTTVVVSDLIARVGEIYGKIWPEPCRNAIVTPIISTINSAPVGVFIAGLSPRLECDQDYQTFVYLVVSNIGQSFDSVWAYESQQRRLDELAKIDQAKTVFFTNISHEFRTPLSLMLGPLADSLADQAHPLTFAQRDRQLMVQRNALRLLKLVNAILDFSRIEAGRAQVSFAPTDLAKITQELCQLFSSLMYQSSLEYVLEIEPLSQPVYVDIDMWEKIVMNLISNAYKFTLQGRIKVTLKQEQDNIYFVVSDTGVGVADSEIPNLFKRFYRIENTQGRSFEGSGIGLAMIQELAKLHGGEITAHSKLGEGTTFTVRIPLGSAHLPKEKVGEGNEERHVLANTKQYMLEEAQNWFSSSDSFDAEESETNKVVTQQMPYRILLADDNVDMRNYIKHILAKYWTVTTAVDGEAAYQLACDDPPDLILSDVMMPRLDGFGLIKKVRDNPVTKRIPVILLSARAGEEAKVEGLGSGADDYLVKTSFSERELLARVRNHLELGRLRAHLEKEVEKKTNELRKLNEALYEFIDMICHEIRNPLHGITGNWELLSERLSSHGNVLQSIIKKDPAEEDIAIVNNITEMKDYLTNIEECTDYQTQVVDEAMFLSKMYSNKFELSPSDCNMKKMLEEVVQRFTAKLENLRIHIDMQLDNIGDIRVDARCLTHILATLLIHTMDNVSEGSTITIKLFMSTNDLLGRLTTQITSESLRQDPQGFSNLIAMQQHSFANRSVGSHYSNTGFSLAISNNLVKIMGGEAIVIIPRAGTVGSGFEFSINCDVLPTPRRPSSDMSTQQPLERALTFKALVAEDNYINQVLCRCLLKKKGYECIIASNGREAVEKYEPGLYDFILMDIAMPEMDGIQVTRRIRELEAAKNVVHPVRIIGLSAYAQPEKVLEAIKVGMNDFVSKPATLDKIGDILKKWTN